MLIAILNQSTLVSDEDAATMTQAIAAQVRLDVAPLWDRAPAAVIFYTDPKAVPAAAHVIAVVDTIKDQPQARRGTTPRTKAGGCGAWRRQSRSSTIAERPRQGTGASPASSPRGARDVHRPELQPVGQRRPRVGVQLRGVRPGRGPQLRRQRCLGIQLRDPGLVRPAVHRPPRSSTSSASSMPRSAFSRAATSSTKPPAPSTSSSATTFPDWRKKMKSGKLARTRRRLQQTEALFADATV